MAGTARDEAERLVAAVLAMAGSAGARDKVTAGLGALGETVAGFLGGQPEGGESNAGRSGGSSRSDTSRSDTSQSDARQPSGHGGWATGSAECCVCPVCRVIASMRDPSPETAVRLAVGAGDLATGVASVMRAFSAMAGERPRPAAPARPRAADPDQAWSAATRTANRSGDAWSAATNVRSAGSSGDAVTSGDAVGSAGSGGDAVTSAGSSVDAVGSAGSGGDGAASGSADPWAAATGASAARAAAEHAVRAEARAARRAAEQAAQRAAARAAAGRAKEAAERVAEAVRLAEAGSGRPAGGGLGSRTPRKLDVWAAATADAGVADVGGSATLDHESRDDDGQNGPGDDVRGASAPEDRGGVAGDGARDGDAV